jgi:hypothetical protein
MKLIKGIYTKRYEVELFEANGKYIVRQASESGGFSTEFISDYNTVSYIFDSIVEGLEGN